MLFGAGLTVGLLGQIAEGDQLGPAGADLRRSGAGCSRSRRSTRPALADLTADTVGFEKLAIDLGPFGGAQSGGAALWIFALAYLVAVGRRRRPPALAAATS